MPREKIIQACDVPTELFSRIARFAKARHLPIPMRTAAWGRRHARIIIGNPRRYPAKQELGAGYYGCVFRSTDPHVVIKVTTDPTEAAFAKLYPVFRKERVWLNGAVQYFAVALLKDVGLMSAATEAEAVSGDGWVIWREDACHVANWVHPIARQYGYDAPEEAGHILYSLRESALSIRRLYGFAHGEAEDRQWYEDCRRGLNMLADSRGECVGQHARRLWGMPNAQQLCSRFNNYWDLLDHAAKHPVVERVARTMASLADAGVVLADVHEDNVGLPCHRGTSERDQLVITDPGHMVPLKDWGEIAFPVIQ